MRRYVEIFAEGFTQYPRQRIEYCIQQEHDIVFRRCKCMEENRSTVLCSSVIIVCHTCVYDIVVNRDLS